MKLVVKMILFSLVLNFVIGVVATALPVFQSNSDFRGGLSYQPNYGNNVYEFNNTVQAAGQVEKTNSFLNSLFDYIGLGFLNQLSSFVDNYLFGFYNMLEAIFSPYLGTALSLMLFGGFKLIITILNVLFGIYLFTGKDLTNNWFGN